MGRLEALRGGTYIGPAPFSSMLRMSLSRSMSDWTAAVEASGLRLCDALRLALATVRVVLSGHDRERVQQHAVHSVQQAVRSFVSGGCSGHPTCGKGPAPSRGCAFKQAAASEPLSHRRSAGLGAQLGRVGVGLAEVRGAQRGPRGPREHTGSPQTRASARLGAGIDVSGRGVTSLTPGTGG